MARWSGRVEEMRIFFLFIYVYVYFSRKGVMLKYFENIIANTESDTSDMKCR